MAWVREGFHAICGWCPQTLRRWRWLASTFLSRWWQLGRWPAADVAMGLRKCWWYKFIMRMMANVCNLVLSRYPWNILESFSYYMLVKLVSTRQVSTFLQKIKHIATDMAMHDKSKLPDAMSNWKNIAGAAFFPRHRICMKVAESFEQDNEGLHCFCTGSGSCYAPHITAPWWWGLSHTHSFNVNVSHLSELCR